MVRQLFGTAGGRSVKTYLTIEKKAYQKLTEHLLPPNVRREQAAFLFAHTQHKKHTICFAVAGFKLLLPEDFVCQEGDFIAMTDSTRGALIKQAHDMAASLIEIHSHLGPWKAAFSLADREGLKETVPHMWWRLNRRPYLALVIAKSGFDALVWVDNPTVPQALDGLLVNGQTLTPTNASLWGW